MGCCTSSGKINRKPGEIQLDHITLRKNGTPECITPNVGFVIKSKRSDGSKVFINIYYHIYIREKYPLPLENAFDKSGANCEVYGVVFPQVAFINSGKNAITRDKVPVLAPF